MQPTRGDVVRSADPFKRGSERQRPWLILNNDTHPFTGEQYIAVAVSTKRYENSIPLRDDHWTVGGVPRDSFVAPWAVHSPRGEDFIAWQGTLTESLIRRVVEQVESYLDDHES